jgi:hypothetical protein
VNRLYTAPDLLAIVRAGLRDIGYRSELLRETYPFPDILDDATNEVMRD